MLRLTLREAALGAQREVIVRALRRCVDCDGIGARPGSRVTCCAVCRGEGQVVRFAGGCSGAGRPSACVITARSTLRRLLPSALLHYMPPPYCILGRSLHNL